MNDFTWISEIVGGDGWFYAIADYSVSTGEKYYVRAWNAPSAQEATYYGDDSSLYTAIGTMVEYYDCGGFGTDVEIPVPPYKTIWTVRNQELDGNKFRFDIYVAFAGSATDFKLANCSLRIDFNPQALANPICMADLDDLVYTDFYIQSGPYTHRWVRDNNIYVVILPSYPNTMSVNTNLVVIPYNNQGYTDSLLPLLSTDPAALHNSIEFDIIDPSEPFNLEWNTFWGSEIGRKMSDESAEMIEDQAIFIPIGDCWDSDGDSFEDEICGGEDCDDTDPLVYPGYPESHQMGNCVDGKDNDCDGLIDTDPECTPPCSALTTPNLGISFAFFLIPAMILFFFSRRLFVNCPSNQ